MESVETTRVIRGRVTRNSTRQQARAIIGGMLVLGVTLLALPGRGNAAPVESILYSFQGGNDGSHPTSGLAADSTGTLYGVTAQGGTGCTPGQGCGTAFTLTPPPISGGAWTEIVIHNFAGNIGADGADPEGVLLLRGGGVYGATHNGGATEDWGTAFRLQRPAVSGGVWNERILRSFGQFGGANLLHGGLLAGKDETLYVTGAGGKTTLGAVVELTPPVGGAGSWPETLLYSFVGGSGPAGTLVADANGVLYGAAYGGFLSLGCGFVYSLTPRS